MLVTAGMTMASHATRWSGAVCAVAITAACSTRSECQSEPVPAPVPLTECRQEGCASPLVCVRSLQRRMIRQHDDTPGCELPCDASGACPNGKLCQHARETDVQICVDPSFAWLDLERTLLSQRAMQLREGMSRVEVISVLGSPTWALLAEDREAITLHDDRRLMLFGDNGDRQPVGASFDHHDRLLGWGTGFLPGDRESLPDIERYGCSVATRRQYCVP
jgi:hypothetical protein